MAKRVPKETITVQRTADGKTTAGPSNPLVSFQPPIGKSFDFTDAEIKDIERMNPTAFDVVEVVNVVDHETVVDAAAKAKAAADAESAAKAKAAAVKPASKPAGEI